MALLFVSLGAIMIEPRAEAMASERERDVAETEREVFWSWSTLEPDTVASAWLLERFASPGCEIVLVPKGEDADRGTPFDLPFADLSRTRIHSTFHVIRERMGVERPGLLALEALVDEVEVRSWQRLPSEVSTRLDSELRAVIESSADPRLALREGYSVLDRWIEELQQQERRGNSE